MPSHFEVKHQTSVILLPKLFSPKFILSFIEFPLLETALKYCCYQSFHLVSQSLSTLGNFIPFCGFRVPLHPDGLQMLHL